MDLSKAKYILPNLFTLASVCTGFYSMILVSGADTVSQMSLAVWMLVISMVMDGLDGRVARATNTQSEFGVQLDSLADAIAFGVAPAFLVFKWGLEPLGFLGVLAGFAFVACGIMRLARFNVQAAKATGPSKHFTGLPIPLAAGTLISVILAHMTLTGKMQTGGSGSAALMTLLLGGLMVSNVPYRTFKKIRLRGRAGFVLLGLVTYLIAGSATMGAGATFASVLLLYIFIGLTEYTLGLRKRGRGIVEEALGEDTDEELEARKVEVD